MSCAGGLRPARAVACWIAAAATALAQVPSPTPAPTASPVPAPSVIRLTDPPVISLSRLPEENPFGRVVEAPAALPAKPSFTEASLAAPFYAAVRVDRTGRVSQMRRVRDPIPSLSAESKRSFERWSFDPARKDGQPVESWASLRIDLQVEVRPPRVEQLSMNPITPTTSLAAPFDWRTDAAWYESARSAPPADGTVPVEQADILATPKKTKWDADSYKGPFSCRFWVKVGTTGRVEKSIPIQVSDPILIAYVRKQIATWQLKPARIQGQPADSWNDLLLAGQIGYSIELKQIANLRKSLAGS